MLPNELTLFDMKYDSVFTLYSFLFGFLLIGQIDREAVRGIMDSRTCFVIDLTSLMESRGELGMCCFLNGSFGLVALVI